MNISDDLEDIYESANGDLEVVREILCDALSQMKNKFKIAIKQQLSFSNFGTP